MKTIDPKDVFFFEREEIHPAVLECLRTNKSVESLLKKHRIIPKHFYEELYKDFCLSPTSLRHVIAGSHSCKTERRVGYLAAWIPLEDDEINTAVELKLDILNQKRYPSIGRTLGFRVLNIKAFVGDDSDKIVSVDRDTTIRGDTNCRLTQETVIGNMNNGDSIVIENRSVDDLSYNERRFVLNTGWLSDSGVKRHPENSTVVVLVGVPIVTSLSADEIYEILVDYAEHYAVPNKTFNSQNHTQEESTMTSRVPIEVIEHAAKELVNTNDTVATIISRTNSIPPDFYQAFRSRYGCTPTEYRQNVRLENQEKRLDEETANVPWEFSVTIDQVNHMTGMEAPYGPGPSINGLHVVPITVNETFEFWVKLVTHKGKCPYTIVNELLEGNHKDMLVDQILEKLSPYFYGRINLAYFHLPKRPTGPSIPSYAARWPGTDRG